MTRSRTAIGTPNNTRKLPRSSGLIAKFAAPFVSKQRSPIEQEISLDDPFRLYFPGDEVKGTVHLNVTKALRATHLVVRLHGFVKVINNARSPGENIAYDESLLTSTKGRRGIEYFGNGFARLFEDESTLCGDGCLSGQYQFRFELMLPPMNVPSSIDFEHGTISYLLSSALTRPNTISPVSTCHRKLKVKEAIDIAPIPKPTSHMVSLKATGKNARPKTHVKRKTISIPNDKAQKLSNHDEANDDQTIDSSALNNEDLPGSPSPSEIDNTSVTSSSTSSNQTGIGSFYPIEDPQNSFDARAFTLSGRTIIAQTQVSQGGCLPGDVLQVKISVDHIRPIKSMQGIIITLYRLGRIDTHPDIPLGPSESGGKRRYEDYIPKSRTGLGGLSLSSAGSSRTFRQDLAQTITPLIVDPYSLAATVRTSIQVPEDVFPTITCVPGSMISFRYYVEVVIDLRGKLAGQDKFLQLLNMIEEPKHGYGDPKISRVDGAEGTSYSATPGFNYLITDQIRRTKGVVFTVTEVIVGTRDSFRAAAKQRENSDSTGVDGTSTDRDSHEDGNLSRGINSEDNHLSDYVGGPDTWQHAEDDHYAESVRNTEEPLGEKAHIRRAEQTLLPSSPHMNVESSSAVSQIPTAPFAYNEEDFVQRYRLHGPAPAYDGPSIASPAMRTQPSPTNSQNRIVQAEADTSISPRHEGDKQELERQRLQALTSSPDDDQELEPGTKTTAPHVMHLTPSAPVLFQDGLPEATPGVNSPTPLHGHTRESGDDSQEPSLQKLEKENTISPDESNSQEIEPLQATTLESTEQKDHEPINPSSPDGHDTHETRDQDSLIVKRR